MQRSAPRLSVSWPRADRCAVRSGSRPRSGNHDARGLQPLRIEGGTSRRRPRQRCFRVPGRGDRRITRDRRPGRRSHRSRCNRLPKARARAPCGVPNRLSARRSGPRSRPGADGRAESRVEPTTREGPAARGSKPPGQRSVQEAAVVFNAMLEGLANAELRGSVFRNLPEGDEATAWHDALATVIAGFARGKRNNTLTRAAPHAAAPVLRGAPDRCVAGRARAPPRPTR